MVYEFTRTAGGIDHRDTILVSERTQEGLRIYAYASPRGRIEGVFDLDSGNLVALRITGEDGTFDELPLPSLDEVECAADSLSRLFAERRAEGEESGFMYANRVESGIELTVGGRVLLCRHHIYTFRLPDDLGGDEMVLLEFWESTDVPRIVPPQMANTLSMYVTGSLRTPWYTVIEGGIVVLETQSKRFNLLRTCFKSP
jgi:hypothetical protein